VLDLTIGIKVKVTSLILNKGEIVVGGINCPEARWAKWQSNCDIWVAILFSRKSYTLTNGYNFGPSGKRSIQHMLKNCWLSELKAMLNCGKLVLKERHIILNTLRR